MAASKCASGVYRGRGLCHTSVRREQYGTVSPYYTPYPIHTQGTMILRDGFKARAARRRIAEHVLVGS